VHTDVLTSGSSQEAPGGSYQPKKHSYTAETALHEEVVGNDPVDDFDNLIRHKNGYILTVNDYLLPLNDKTIVPSLKENLSKLNDQSNTRIDFCEELCKDVLFAHICDNTSQQFS